MIQIDLNKRLQAAEGEMLLKLKIDIEKGEFVTLYGASGVGKTSTLRIISGLLNPDVGKIIVNDEVWFDQSKKINLSPQKRKVGYVFQDYALFPHMTVLENLKFAQIKKDGTKAITSLIELMELGQLQNRNPETLSGGQKQRVALARALVQQPEILLLDEPLAALDTTIRYKLQEYLKQIHSEFKLTTILISHDVSEIVKLADRVICLEDGKIINQGTPEHVFINQNLSGKFKFTGEVLKVSNEELISIVTVRIHTEVVKVVVQPKEAQNLNVGDKVLVVSKAFNPLLYKLEG
ncbi:sulfate/molybdate ABC transporter ATP-binding protein [Leeuwenhoekiella sp. LLG6367-2.1]|uniref:sulfate/molybdate ABC transporter ATP-binding protein n=1 Tax=Leeuwenhoekiella sp. LLG6367-2.1 TaxID=3160833 RepID=UPI00386EB09D